MSHGTFRRRSRITSTIVGRQTFLSVVRDCLDVITAGNAQLQAFVAQGAIRRAEELDRRIAASGPVDDMPITVKIGKPPRRTSRCQAKRG
jgi:hypothetical protein